MEYEKKVRTRRWAFTLNNPTMTAKDLCEKLFSKYATRYVIAGDEVAPTTGTLHLQGYVEFEHPATLAQVVARVPKAHFEPALGSNAQNRNYCTKGGSFYELGTLNTRVQGSEEAAEVVILIVEGGIHPSQVAVQRREFASYVVNHYTALLAMWRERELA